MSQPGFENPGRTRIGTAHAPKPVQTKRDLVVEFVDWGCAHQQEIHYGEIRPIPKVKAGTLPKLPFTTDCSGFATMAYQYARAPDPNGLSYDGNGYTGTLLKHGTKVPARKVRPGDLVVYGTKAIPTGHHAAVVISVSGPVWRRTILTGSHGNENGPYKITVPDEAKFQPPGITYISYLP